MDPPVYVEISKYKELTAILKRIQAKLATADETIAEIQKVKAEEDAKISEWRESLEMIRTKVQGVTDTLHQ